MAANAYAVLEVPEDASVEVIRKAQRRLVFACHEGMHGLERERRLKRINLAADELTDPSRRRALDDNIARERQRQQAPVASSVEASVIASVMQARAFGAAIAEVAGLAAKLAIVSAITNAARTSGSRDSCCKAIKADGRRCRNPPLAGNYGFCGVHRN
jgi:curved DNA-binding protein CbpA